MSVTETFVACIFPSTQRVIIAAHVQHAAIIAVWI